MGYHCTWQHSLQFDEFFRLNFSNWIFIADDLDHTFLEKGL